jgi:ferredoxin
VTVQYVAKDELNRWLAALSPGGSVYIPQPTANGAWVHPQDDLHKAPAALELPRAAQSGKGFLMPAAETVARYGAGAGPAVAVAEAPVVLVGVRACGLRAWKYLDKVMLEGEFTDPFYRARRERTVIVSCDCADCADTCFCVLVGGKPHVEAEAGSDINLSLVGDGYLAEPMSEKGRQAMASATGAAGQATAEQLAQRDQARRDMLERVKRQNTDFSFWATDEEAPDLPEGDDPAWQKFAADCVECGACTNICPTCYCFYLYDQIAAGKGNNRVRNWDSCLLATYHRMAGGVSMKITPRPELRNRLANRILHKFVYSLQQYGLIGCVGCGRCIDACLGAIDIRRVVEDLKK